jgi:FkbM family methyltransferase
LFAGDKNVKIVNKALGEKTGVAKMYVSSADVLSSLSKEFIEKTSKSGRFQEGWWNKEEEVEVTTLDRLIAEYGKPKFIKIDVEGFELQVVKGLSQPIEMISLEYTPELTSNLKAAIEHLETLGNYEFNLSWCESMVMSRSQWLGKEKIFQLMDSMVDEMYLFGDIYLKRK